MRYIYNKVRVLLIGKDKPLFRLRYIIGILLGGILGFLYYFLTNLVSTHPVFASSPWFTTIYGLFLGGLISRG
jgi:drug/metabolite transporter (DMT)-like permease